ncbi:bacterio-opsin activator domain-containing protein [Halocatena marina]|uniref:Bacterio-opsin activator domain-containing protein n=1 Tax=Halocatena marina TaxID=2934937 RepID=A0ABD5YTQ7_9EURY
MATIVEFTVNAGQFPGTIFKNVEDVTVELERVVPKTEGVVPYFWIEDMDMADIVAQFSEHPGVRNITVVDTFGSRHLMKCKWVRKYEGILTGLAKSDIVLLSAVGTEDGWRFEIRGDDADSISTFKEYCECNDISIDITSVSALTEPEAAKS